MIHEIDFIDRALDQLKSVGFDAVSCFSFKQKHSLYKEDAEFFRSWIESKQHGEMGYLERRQSERLDPTSFFPDLDTVFVVLKRYGPVEGLPTSLAEMNHSERPENVTEVLYSHYLNGVDYHDSIKALMTKAMTSVFSSQSKYKVCVDTSPVLERTMARLSGLGFTGKNTLLIHPKLGSMTFIGVVLTSLPYSNTSMDESEIPFSLCGSCNRCIEACPTNAITPFQLDSNKCISYLTLEKRGPFSENEQALDFKGYVAGCDICQIVCPFNFKPFKYVSAEKKTRPLDRNSLNELILETESEYRARTKGTALSRIKFADFKRNLEQNKKLNSNEHK